ncbi:DUF4373 domain-containing protein [Ruminococcus sp.]|uniref:DUF4373 domain-containing protein n=1 Tax=Ruminococcus sp. TaxID=41978 RepID=UPI0035270859
MAGRPKQGIDYAGWSVDIFDGDKKIDKLLDAKGWKGFGIYFFLCQRAYKTNGYYYEWGYDDCATTARKMGGGINSGTVKETVDYCLQVDLFDKRLFDEWGVLTSRGIQRRFWAVLSERRSKTVYQEYWLLKSEECKGLVKVSLKSDVQPTNSNVQSANDDMSPIKKSKVNNIYNIKQFSPELEQPFQTYLLVRKHNFGELIPEQENALREELQKIADNDAERLAIVKKATVSGWKSFYKTTTKKTDAPRKKSKSPVKNLNNFKRRDYDMDSLENQLLNN